MAKKVLGLFLALGVIAGSFAVPVGDSGLDISGTINTGIQVTGWAQDDYKGADGSQVVKFLSDGIGDDEQSGIGLDVNFKYEKDNVGADATIRARDGSTLNAVKLDHAYGWAKAFNGMFKVTAGYNLNGAWGTGVGSEGNVTDAWIDGSRSVRLEGLLLGGNLSVGAAFFNGSDLAAVDEHMDLLEHLKFTTIGAAYTSSAFKASLAMTFNAAKVDGLWNYNDTSWVYPGPGAEEYPFKDHTYFQAVGGLSYLGVPNLTASLDFNAWAASAKADADAKEDKLSFFGIGPYVKYQINDPFSVALLLRMRMNGVTTAGEEAASKGDFRIRLTPAYKINEKLSADLRLQFDFAAFENDKYKKAHGDSDYKGESTFTIRPKLNVNFGNGASFYTFYTIDVKTPEKMSTVDVKNITTHTLQLEFTYSF